MPTRKSSGAAVLNVHVAKPITIPSGCSRLVPTGLAMAIPTGIYGRLASRSGLAAREIHVQAGVLDSDYRGELLVWVQGSSEDSFAVRIGDRVAQLIFEQISVSNCEEHEDLGTTERGSNGFGSAGPRDESSESLSKGGSTDVYDTANTVSSDFDRHLHHSNATTTNGDNTTQKNATTNVIMISKVSEYSASGNSVPACCQSSALSTDDDFERLAQIHNMGAILRSVTIASGPTMSHRLKGRM